MAVKVTLVAKLTASVLVHGLVVVFQVSVPAFALKLILLLLVLMVIGVEVILKPMELSVITK